MSERVELKGTPVERVSLIVPMLNEAEHVQHLVDDVAAQDFVGPAELLVADGGSTDGSAERLREAASAAGVELILLDNPERYVSAGLNACVRRARGDLIVRLDCHARYPTDYLRRCAAAAAETGAWNVGGIVVPEGRTPAERAAASAMDSPFGGIGWSRLGGGGGRVETDTVTYGAFRPAAFEAVGLFDESLVRNQDDEFNLRLRRAGGTVVLDPSIRVVYVPRPSLRAAFRQYFEYGSWKIPVMRKHRQVLGLRSMAPLMLVLSLVGLALAGIWLSAARSALLAEVALYVTLAILFGTRSIRRRHEPVSLLPRVLASFAAFHFGYGLGMMRGLARR